MKRFSFIIYILLGSCAIFAQESDGINIRIAKYKGDKACAISYTFDDGLKEHYTLVAPVFEKSGFKGTFWINGAKINEDENAITDTTRMTWNELKDMATAGHEISNHGWAHKNFKRHTLDEIKEDIFKNDSAIFAHIGIMPRTFCYPNNATTPEGIKIASVNRVGTRTKQRSIGSKSTPEDLENWVNTLIETNDWGIGMTHGITYGYDAFGNPQCFWNHLEYVKTKEDRIWVGTFLEVASYVKERENTQLHLTYEEGLITITPEFSLDKNLFTEPLTAVIETMSLKNVTVEQNNQMLNTQIYPDKIRFDFNPSEGPIYINTSWSTR